jgi:ubiquinone/menaquinone biosynthesis C-methylase UbiE
LLKKRLKVQKIKLGRKMFLRANLKKLIFSTTLLMQLLWDVLAIVDDPCDELKECYRLLKKGGKIGLRTRNVYFQKSAYLGYKIFKQIFSKLGFKEPYVFNKFCFSAQSVQILLSRLGFQNVKISNSPLTLGDPYQHSCFSLPIKMVKQKFQR